MTFPTLQSSRAARYFYVFANYVMQGLPAGFAFTALVNWYAAEGFTLAQTGRFIAIASAPWAFKFFWGPLIDRFQFPAMGRRRPWILFAQLMSCLAIGATLAVGDPSDGIETLAYLLFAHSFFASLQDVAIDALVIEVTPIRERGRISAIVRCGMVLGEAAGAAGFAWMLRRASFRAAVGVELAVLLMVTSLSVLLLERDGERRAPWSAGRARSLSGSTPRRGLGAIVASLVRAIAAPCSIAFAASALFVFMTVAMVRHALGIHLIQQLSWSDTELSSLKGIAGAIARLIGVGVGGLLADRLGARRALVGGIALLAALLAALWFGPIWWSDTSAMSAYLLADLALLAALNVAALPLFMGLCRPSIAGSQFAAYMALWNLATAAGPWIGGQISASFGLSLPGLAMVGALALALGALAIARMRWLAEASDEPT